MRKNLILFWAIIILPALFFSCENTPETTKEEDDENEKAAINLVLTSKNWTVTSYKLNFSEENKLEEFMNKEFGVGTDRSESENGSSYCEHELFLTMRNVDVNFTSKESITQSGYGRRETFTGSACDENDKSGVLPDTSRTFRSAYVLDIDKLKLTANFGNPLGVIGEGIESDAFKMQYNIVSYSKTKVELSGEKTIDGEGTLYIQLVLE